MGWNYLSFPKLQRWNRWSLRIDKQFYPTHYNVCYYIFMSGINFNHVSKRDPRYVGPDKDLTMGYLSKYKMRMAVSWRHCTVFFILICNISMDISMNTLITDIYSKPIFGTSNIIKVLGIVLLLAENKMQQLSRECLNCHELALRQLIWQAISTHTEIKNDSRNQF